MQQFIYVNISQDYIVRASVYVFNTAAMQLLKSEGRASHCASAEVGVPDPGVGTRSRRRDSFMFLNILIRMFERDHLPATVTRRESNRLARPRRRRNT